MAASTGKTGKVTFTVTRTDRYTLNIGDIPAGLVWGLIQKAAEDYPPSLFLADSDWGLGTGADFGDATVENVTVELD